MKAVILCDGTPPTREMIQKELSAGENTLLIAADGGAYTAERLSLEPDIIIGDLDTYSPDGTERAEVIRVPDQETNDLEKELNEALKRGIRRSVVLGATGRRHAHTLQNQSVFYNY